MISINVQNDSTAATDFLYFMEPAASRNFAPFYVTSLGTARLAPYRQSAAIVTFLIDFQYQAGVQQAYSPPVAGQQSGFASACRPIALSTGTGAALNATTMLLNPLGLSEPEAVSTVSPGAFRIVTPTYDSNSLTYNAGTGLRTKAGGVVLPSFIVAGPNLAIDITPSMTFEVATGSAKTGVVISPADYARSGTCNAAQYTAFLVVYDAKGAFSVTGFPHDGLFLESFNATTSGGPAALRRVFVPL